VPGTPTALPATSTPTDTPTAPPPTATSTACPTPKRGDHGHKNGGYGGHRKTPTPAACPTPTKTAVPGDAGCDRADVTGDGRVNWKDALAVAVHLGSRHAALDVNGDGRVTLKDLVIVVRCWLFTA
jgi:hypothetical protein